ncbi:hypothetical protein R5R35_011117 [Gryllus longicercus]|uniref:Probable imidazolonepropionase n=1 Tax=Gryllus longicercus TaxID=2509291 RepID=A0AAN9VCT4_9ORTH
MRLLVHSARQLALVTGAGGAAAAAGPLVGPAMHAIAVLESDAGLALVADESGRIEEFGNNTEIMKKWQDTSFDEVVDANGMCVIPGFIDAHTHPIWSGDRINEFIMKLEGATYMDIHKKGGGIYSTVRNTKNASDEELYVSLKSRLTRMMHAGTTVVECKSGYGLDVNSEIRLLKILQKAKEEHPLDISITFCGAHAIPEGMNSTEAVDAVVNDQIPAVKEMKQNGTLNVENIDVFCEKGVFNVEESRKILTAGKNIGLRVNFHGDELCALGSAEMGAQLNATAISHLEEISAEGIAAMANSGVVAVILPTTAFIMHLKPPPVRQLISHGVPVALGTDFNPNAYCLAMPLVMHLACIHLGMTVNEALVASTLNAAASLGRSATNGSIQKGKWADFVIVNAPRWEHIIYQYGAHSHLIYAVIKDGKVVYKNKEFSRSTV